MPLLTSDSWRRYWGVVYFGVRGRMMIDSLTEGTVDSLKERPNFEVAPVWIRLLAGVVDWLVVLAWGAGLGIVAALFFGLLNVSSFGLNFILGSIFLGFPIMCVVVVWKQVAIAFRISSTGQTLGHQLLGFRIATKNKEVIGRRRALVRQILGSPLLFAHFLPMIPLIPVAVFIDLIGGLGDAIVTNWLIWGLGVAAVLAIANHVWMAMDVRGRGWHDRLTGTVVVRDGLCEKSRMR